MKITRLRTVVVDLPIKPPIISAIFAIHSTSCILCFLETDQGLVGEGQAMIRCLTEGADPSLVLCVRLSSRPSRSWR
jgi:hypothetical protein